MVFVLHPLFLSCIEIVHGRHKIACAFSSHVIAKDGSGVVCDKGAPSKLKVTLTVTEACRRPSVVWKKYVRVEEKKGSHLKEKQK